MVVVVVGGWGMGMGGGGSEPRTKRRREDETGVNISRRINVILKGYTDMDCALSNSRRSAMGLDLWPLDKLKKKKQKAML